MENHVTSFFLKQGIRQGDSISPYIFTICVEYFGGCMHFMSTQKRSGICIKLAKDCQEIPFLMFADDCLIFCRASKKAVRNTMYIFNHCCRVSRQL